MNKRTFGFTPTPVLASFRFFKNVFQHKFFRVLSSAKSEEYLAKQKAMPKQVWGFTLIETLMVVSIIGTLTAIMYTSFDSARATNRDQRRVSDLASIRLGLEIYFNQNRQYPAELSDLVGVYVSEIPTPPSKASDPLFQYNYVPLKHVAGPSVCTSYQLWTSFETSNNALLNKRGLNSTENPTANGLHKCAGGVGVNAASEARVYDLVP